MALNPVETHIDLIKQHEQEFLAKRTQSERLGDQIAIFVGSFGFVGVWIGWNVYPGILHFDPSPFSLLGTVLAMEAIILASFILMRQARMARRGDERDHLMLQILILTEREITAVLKVDRQIAQQVGAANTAEVRELSQTTSIEDVAQSVRENLDSVLEATSEL